MTRPILVLASAVVLLLPTAAAAQDPAAPAVTVPGQPAVTFAEVDHWSDIARRDGADEDRDVPRQVLQFLASSRWIAGEAAERGITITDASVEAKLQRHTRELFDSEAEYEAFLRRSGQTEDDLRLRVRTEALSDRLRDVATRGAQPTEAETRAEYRRTRSRYAVPQRRDLRIVVARSWASARRALAALRAGRSWDSVARRSSIDRATRYRGGRVDRAARSDLPRAVSSAAFAAPRGTLVGPVRTSLGTFVLSVRRIRPARPPSYRRARATVRLLLRTEREQRALEAFVAEYERRWTARTTCAPGRVEAACHAVIAPR